ncbi:MAG: hypothetical protein LBB10_02400, partial [Bifidobacteriaceae bacterium]|nr:hypothetical protein [Bifidobacteriaceae bacterium]
MADNIDDKVDPWKPNISTGSKNSTNKDSINKKSIDSNDLNPPEFKIPEFETVETKTNEASKVTDENKGNSENEKLNAENIETKKKSLKDSKFFTNPFYSTITAAVVSAVLVFTLIYAGSW